MMTATDPVRESRTEIPSVSHRPAERGWLAAWRSPAVWSRIAVGFAALCLVKMIMLVSLREGLFEIHYRVNDEPVTWLNFIAFYLFAVLAGLNLWKLSARCLPAGAKVVRAANACVLFLAGVFLFLTFHEGDKNYLYAMMNGILGGKEILWYLINSFCFRMPYLAVWVLAYAFTYYGFWRKGREHWMLRVTAVFATAYIVLCLGDLKEFRNALIVIDCLGIACLVLNGGGSLNPFWMALPVIGASSLFFLFRPFHYDLGLTHMNGEFTVLLWGCLLLLAGVTLMAWRRGFLAGWWRILPFAIASLLLVNTYYPQYANYENLLCMGFMLPRYFLGEFGVMLALLGLAVVYRKLRPRGTLLWLDIVNLLLITIALADLRLTQIMDARLDWDALSLAMGETTKMMWRMARPYLPSLALALVVMTALYALALWAMRRINSGTGVSPVSPNSHGRDARATTPSRSGRSLAFAVVACLLLAIAGIALAPGDKAEGQTLVRFAETTPLFKRGATPLMDRDTFLKTATALGLGDMCAPPPTAPAHPCRDLNVVLIFQESTYNKHLSMFDGKEDTQPLLSQYRNRMELFPNFFSVFAGSMNARFATFTGLYPVADYHAFTAERVPVKSIFETLHDNGYTCSMFYSSYFDYTDFRDFLRDRGFDAMYDADTMPGPRKDAGVSWGLHESETLGAIRAQIKTYATNNQKFFLTYVPAAPHNPFDGTPREFQKYKMKMFGDLTPFYYNELLYMDWVKASIVDQLKESGLLDKTLVIITADHGEMLGENGGPVGHGWAITPELANIPLIIMDPGHPGYHVNDTIGSQVDLLPTILDSLGIAIPQGQLYQGASLYSPDLNTNRTIYMNSFRQYGEIQGARFVQGGRDSEKDGSASGREVFDIGNDGSHTSFAPLQLPALDAPSISTFDSFQKNLLRNYSAYTQMFHP